MGYVAVKFLGEEYQVSETINEFLGYNGLLNPMRQRLLDALSTDLRWASGSVYFSQMRVELIQGRVEKYLKIVEDSAELLLKKMFELGVYDVTKNDLLNGISPTEEITELEKLVLNKIIAEARKYVSLKEAGMERAYRYAASNITGTGVRVFTNSFSTFMLHSMVERSVLLSQAKKADREYEAAVREINNRAREAMDKVCSEVLVGEFFPLLLPIMLEFDHKIMTVFLSQLAVRGKFDHECLEKYNMNKAEEIIKNIDRVPDKIEFLKQMFILCPFSSVLYEECFKQGVLDKDTFNTARYFSVEADVVEKMEEFINQNAKNIDKVKPCIEIISEYRGISETSVWRNVYEDSINKIEGIYRTLNNALSNKRNLDKFIRENIVNRVDEILDKTEEDITESINKVLKNIVSEGQFNTLLNVGVLVPETIRMESSVSTTLFKINNEIAEALVGEIMDYIAEAKRRFQLYETAYTKYTGELKIKKEEFSKLEEEKRNLGFFAFSKKKELEERIDTKGKEIMQYQKEHEPVDLWQNFERMYR